MEEKDSQSKSSESSEETSGSSFQSPITSYSITDQNQQEVYDRFNHSYQSLYRCREYAIQRKIKHQKRPEKLDAWTRILADINTCISALTHDFQHLISFKTYYTDLNELDQKIRGFITLCKFKSEDLSTPVSSHIHDQIQENKEPMELLDQYIEALSILSLVCTRQYFYYFTKNIGSPKTRELAVKSSDIERRLSNAIAYKKTLEDDSPYKKTPPELQTYIAEFKNKYSYVFAQYQSIGLGQEIVVLLSNYYHFQKGLEQLEKEVREVIESHTYPEGSDQANDCQELLKSILSKKMPLLEYNRSDDELKLNAPNMMTQLNRLKLQFHRILDPELELEDSQAHSSDQPEEFRALDAALAAHNERLRIQEEIVAKSKALIDEDSSESGESVDTSLTEDIEKTGSKKTSPGMPSGEELERADVSVDTFLAVEMAEIASKKTSPDMLSAKELKHADVSVDTSVDTSLTEDTEEKASKRTSPIMSSDKELEHPDESVDTSVDTSLTEDTEEKASKRTYPKIPASESAPSTSPTDPDSSEELAENLKNLQGPTQTDDTSENIPPVEQQNIKPQPTLPLVFSKPDDETEEDLSSKGLSGEQAQPTPPNLFGDQTPPASSPFLGGALPRKKSSPSPRLFEYDPFSSQNVFYEKVKKLGQEIGLSNPRENLHFITFDKIDIVDRQQQTKSVHFQGSPEHWMISGNHRSAMVDLASAITENDDSNTTVITIESQMRHDNDYASMTQDLLALIQFTNQRIPVDTRNLDYLYRLTEDSDRVLNRLVTAFRKDSTLQPLGDFEHQCKTKIGLQFYIRMHIERANAVLQEKRPQPQPKGQQYR